MKTPVFLLALAALTSAVFAEPPAPLDDLRKTLTAAGKDQKMAFILLGRPTCSNCNATKAMIKEGKIPVTADSYVMADLNTDDAKTQAEFMRKFSKEVFGNTLPFIVVTDAKGKALASSSGYKSAEEWKTLLEEAKTKATAKAGSAAPGAPAAGGNWPFNSASAGK